MKQTQTPKEEYFEVFDSTFSDSAAFEHRLDAEITTNSGKKWSMSIIYDDNHSITDTVAMIAELGDFKSLQEVAGKRLTEKEYF